MVDTMVNVNVTKIREFATVVLGAVVVVFITGASFKENAIEFLGVQTVQADKIATEQIRDELDSVTKILTSHIDDVNFDRAVDILRGLQNDLTRHKLEENHASAEWIEKRDRLQTWVILSERYAKCLTGELPGVTDCSRLKKQLQPALFRDY